MEKHKITQLLLNIFLIDKVEILIHKLNLTYEINFVCLIIYYLFNYLL